MKRLRDFFLDGLTIMIVAIAWMVLIGGFVVIIIALFDSFGV